MSGDSAELARSIHEYLLQWPMLSLAGLFLFGLPASRRMHEDSG